MELEKNKSISYVVVIIISLISIISIGLVPSFALSQDEYEENDTFIQAHVIDKLQHHNLHDAGDEDWVMFYGVFQVTYRIKTTNLGTKCNAVIELYESDGTTLLVKKNDNGVGQDEVLEWNCLYEGIYYIKIKNHDPQIFGNNTHYELSCYNFLGYDAYEKDDSFKHARTILLSDKEFQHHNFHAADDEDWVMFYGIHGRFYKIETVNLGSNCDTVIELYDADGTMRDIENGGYTGADESLYLKCEKEGIYYVKVINKDFGENTDYDLKVNYPEGTPPGFIIGKISDADSDKPITEVVHIKTNAGRTTIGRDNGTYLMNHDIYTHILTAEADGYCPYTASVYIEPIGTTLHNIVMTPHTLPHAILCLQILAGRVAIGQENIAGCLDRDKVRQKDVVYILQKISGVR